jgi:hypothetical protein
MVRSKDLFLEYQQENEFINYNMLLYYYGFQNENCDNSL